MSIQVAVRVRPFNTREKEKESKCIISMSGPSTTIHDDVGQEKTFTFDYSFWSHDSFIESSSGYLSPDETGKYADQSLVFDTLGRQILDNAWKGYHCCLFAYGQTGAGKSYSMVGYGTNKGIVPISCEEIFKRISSNTDPSLHFEVEVSMLEIYNEKVQDLLTPPSKRPPSGLKIRESKAVGIFVEGLTKYPVMSYEEISQKMDEGYENRTIGSTVMNATSSRAHTIVTIEFNQVQTIGTTKSAKLSKINLVDLAGSERQKSTEATGDRLKEGCNINKSLLVLGNVINTLADKAMGKKKDVLPPYRDSALTRILQNALGGNSKTVMICALSPASINYEETLSTLRYADRAKKIQNKAVVNESEHDKTVRLLKEENNELKKKIEELSQKILGGKIDNEDKEKFKDLKEQYDATEKIVENMSKTFSERIEEAKKNEREFNYEKVDTNYPHLVVLNEDPQLSHKLKYSLKKLPIYVGRKHGNPTPEIKLSGIGIKQNHAIFIKGKNDNEVILKCNEKEAINYIFINGKKINNEGQLLNNKDRIIFGTNTILLFMVKSDLKDLFEIDWESAQMEFQKEVEKEKQILEEENEKKKKEAYDVLKKNLEQKYNKDKEEIENKMNKQLKEYEIKINEMKNKSEEKLKMEKERDEIELKLKQKIEKLENEKIKRKKEIDYVKSEIIYNNKNNKNIENNFQHESEKLENTLINIYKKISKLKIIISDLKRKVDLDIFLTKNLIEHYNENKSPINIFIRVENFEEGKVYYWSNEIFQNRYELMKDLYNKFLDEDYNINLLKKEEDPLFDYPKQILLGYAFYKLEPLIYLMNNQSTIPIISINGEINGYIIIDLIPHDINGNLFEEIYENPFDLIGNNLYFTVYIKEIFDLPDFFNKGIQVEYTSFSDNNIYKSKIYENESKNSNVVIEEKFEHSIEYLSKEDIEFLLSDKICFKIYGFEEVEKINVTEKPNRNEIILKHQDNSNDDNIVKNNNNSNAIGNLKKQVKYQINKKIKNKECSIY